MKTARKLLCAILLLLFTSEYVAATTAHQQVINSARQSHLVSHEIQGHFSLLAEESEERDHRDTDALIFVRLLVHPGYVYSINRGLRRFTPQALSYRTVPRYTLHRSILI